MTDPDLTMSEDNDIEAHGIQEHSILKPIAPRYAFSPNVPPRINLFLHHSPNMCTSYMIVLQLQI